MVKSGVFVRDGINSLVLDKPRYQPPAMPRTGQKVTLGGGWVVLSLSLVFSLGPS